MPKDNLIISIATHKDARSQDFGRKFFTDWAEQYPQFFPENAGHFDPINTSVSSVDDCLAVWKEANFDWRRKRSVKSEGYLCHYHPNFPATLISVHSSYSQKDNWEEFFLWLANVFEADFGYLHLLTERELQNPGVGPRERSVFSIGTSMKMIELEGIPNLGWLSVFSENFAHNQRLTTNIPSAVVVGCNLTAIKITPRIVDVIESYDAFALAREEIKSRIGLNQKQVRVDESRGCVNNNSKI